MVLLSLVRPVAPASCLGQPGLGRASRLARYRVCSVARVGCNHRNIWGVGRMPASEQLRHQKSVFMPVLEDRMSAHTLGGRGIDVLLPPTYRTQPLLRETAGCYRASQSSPATKFT
jgi:hypothetical protein